MDMNCPYHFFTVMEQVGSQVNKGRSKAIVEEKYCERSTMIEKGKRSSMLDQKTTQSCVPNIKESSMQFLG